MPLVVNKTIQMSPELLTLTESLHARARKGITKLLLDVDAGGNEGKKRMMG